MLARGIIAVAGLTMSALVVLLIWTAWDQARPIPLVAWLQAFGIVGLVTSAVTLLAWAVKHSKL